MHLITDALELPLTFEGTEGQRHDIVPAPTLVQRTRPRRLLADKTVAADGDGDGDVKRRP